MTTFDDLTPGDIHVPVLDEQALECARRTVASYAVDAADCADLLAMLGLSPDADDVPCVECGLPISRMPASGYNAGRGGDGRCRPCYEKAARAAVPSCPYGHRLAAAGDECAICSEYVPLEDLRMLVERIKRDTGMGNQRIAKRAGIRAASLTSALTRSKRQQRVARSTYTAVLRLAQELGA